MAPRTFRRAPDGALVVTLFPQEVELLAMTAHDLLTIVEEPPEGEIRDRLYPRAYLDPTEETAQQEFDALVHDDLVRSRRAALQTIVDGLDAAAPNEMGLVEITLSSEEEQQWLTAVNDGRLVIGTTLGLAEDDETDYAPGDPRFEFGVMYSWLTGLHGELVLLLLDEIGEAGSDDPGGGEPDVSDA
jgi:Domain of unknown function (DUF2017)